VRKILRQERSKESRALIPLSTLSVPRDVGSAGVACCYRGEDPETKKEQRISCSDPFKHTLSGPRDVGSVGVAYCARGEDPDKKGATNLVLWSLEAHYLDHGIWAL
jgi:hypothetical protein